MRSLLAAGASLAATLALSACHAAGPAPTTPTATSTSVSTGKKAEMNVSLHTKAEPKEWYQPEDRHVFLADVLDEKSGSPMSVGFARYARGAWNDWTVTYDEVLVITKGTFTVVSAGRETTAHAGETIFLAKGTALRYRADEAVELVYVTYPHWAEATRKSEHASALDPYHPVPAATVERVLGGK